MGHSLFLKKGWMSEKGLLDGPDEVMLSTFSGN